MSQAIYNHLYEYLAAYMFLALGITIFSGFPVGLVLGGLALLFALGGMVLNLMSSAELYLFADRLWQSAAVNQVLVAVPCFVFMGIMLERSRVAADLLRILQVLLRAVPGGLALAVTLLGTIMAATTGIIGASVVMLSMMALPAMLESGYDKRLASGTVAASATLGILIPPSVMLVIMADLMVIPVGNLFVAAIIPGLLLATLYSVYVILVGSFRPDLAPKVMRRDDEIGTANLLRMLLQGFVPPVALIALVLGSIFAGWATPTEASGVGAFGATLLALAKGRLSWSGLDKVCIQTAMTSAMIFLIFAGATAFSYVFRALYGEDLILDFIAWMNLGHWGFLAMLMLLIFVLGFFFDWIEITLIVLPVFAPVMATLAPDFAATLGMEHLTLAEQKSQMLFWFAILVAVNLQTSFLTPPFGFALFFLKGSAPASVRLGEIYRGIIPFVMIQLVGLGLVATFPLIALWLPRALQ